MRFLFCHVWSAGFDPARFLRSGGDRTAGLGGEHRRPRGALSPWPSDALPSPSMATATYRQRPRTWVRCWLCNTRAATQSSTALTTVLPLVISGARSVARATSPDTVSRFGQVNGGIDDQRGWGCRT